MPPKRTRKPQKKTTVAGRPVSVNVERYARRNERARALGYRNYYDYRIHRNGELPPSEPPPVGEERQRLRGHRGLQDFLDAIREGSVISLVSHISRIERRPNGRYKQIDKMLLLPDGTQRIFTLRNLTREQLLGAIADESARGATWSPAPSLDQRRLASAAELDNLDAEHAEHVARMEARRAKRRRP